MGSTAKFPEGTNCANNFDVGLLASRLGENKFLLVLSSLDVGTLLQQPQETNTDCSHTVLWST